MSEKKILVTGILPPPYGGVSIFIDRLINAIKDKDNISIKIFTIKSLLFGRTSILHINSSHPIKRCFLVFLGWIFAEKVYFLIHGGKFSTNNVFNYLSVYLADGVFCLNKQVEKILKEKNINCFKQTTIFRENIKDIKSNIKPFVANKKKTVLFYIQNNKSIAGEEIYGATFISNVLDKIISQYNIDLLIVDLSQSYRHYFENKPLVTYIDKPVNFIDILSQSDVYIRPTSTDGMSVALLEAGILGVNCLASDVVDRPDFVLTYQFQSEDDFLVKLGLLLNNNKSAQRKLSTDSLTSINDVLDFMEK